MSIPPSVPSTAPAKVLCFTPLTAPGQHRNYLDWSWAVELHIKAADVGHVLRPTPVKDQGPTWSKDNVSLVSMIIQVLEEVNYRYICPHGENAKAVWSALKRAHEDNTSGGCMFWLQKLILTQMSSDKDVLEHIKKMSGIYELLNALTAADRPLTAENIFATSLLISLPSDWLLAISHLFQKADISSEKVIVAIKREATHRGNKDDTVSASVASALVFNATPAPCSFCDHTGHSLDNFWASRRLLREAKSSCLQSRGGASSSSNSSCGRRGGPRRKEKAGSTLVAALESSDEDSDEGQQASVALIAAPDLVTASHVRVKNGAWLLDTGCSHSMSANAEDVIDPVCRFVSVSLANGSAIHSTHLGSAHLPFASPAFVPTLLVPTLDEPLMSVSAL